MKNVVMNLTVRVELELPDDVDGNEAVSDLDYNFFSTTEGVRVVTTEIVDQAEVGETP